MFFTVQTEYCIRSNYPPMACIVRVQIERVQLKKEKALATK